MSNGTLAEKRTLTTTTTEALPTVETPQKVSPEIVKVVEEQSPTKEPALVIDLPKPPLKEPRTKCTYCKVDRIITLSIRGSITLVLLALCFHLIKSATK